MKAVGIFEAKSTLSQLVDQVEAGGEVILTRHGKPVARLVPLVAEDAAASPKGWAAELRTFRHGRDHGAQGGATLADLIRAGRR